MAHFAEVDDNKIVLRVIVVDNSDILDSNGNESEEIGKEFCANLLGGNWIQTSYNKSFRKNFAGTGMLYKQDIDAFIAPKPYESWTLNSNSGQWEAPFPKPEDGKRYDWHEEDQEWVKRI
jgi:hypothetical protein